MRVVWAVRSVIAVQIEGMSVGSLVLATEHRQAEGLAFAVGYMPLLRAVECMR